jgi:small subunit ribosomal protein S18
MAGFGRNKFNKSDVNIEEVDYKNVELLKSFIMEGQRIVPRRISGVSAKIQRKITREIKKARFLALLPYCDNHKYK